MSIFAKLASWRPLFTFVKLTVNTTVLGLTSCAFFHGWGGGGSTVPKFHKISLVPLQYGTTLIVLCNHPPSLFPHPPCCVALNGGVYRGVRLGVRHTDFWLFVLALIQNLVDGIVWYLAITCVTLGTFTPGQHFYLFFFFFFLLNLNHFFKV